MKKTANILQSEIDGLQEKCRILRQRAVDDGRHPTSDETELIKDINTHCGELRNEIAQMPEKSLTLQLGPGGNAKPGVAGRLIAPNGRKGYQDLFGNAGGPEWTDKNTGFFEAVFSGRHHPGLVNSMSTTVPSEGGFLVPEQMASRIHSISLESELVLPRCYVFPMTTMSAKLPAMVIGDHSNALLGGFEASYTPELGTIQQNSPTARSMELTAKKLTGMLRFSAELTQDMVGGESQITTLCGQGLAWFRDKYFLKGNGAGQPLGILNADCLIEVTPEAGQTEPTILYENLTKMMGRLFAGSFKNSIWVCHQSTIPQLLQLSIAVGTGGGHYPVMTESGGEFRILTRPCLFTEKTEVLGSKGDIMLVDFSQYVVGLRAGLRFDTSIHPHFATDEILARLVERHDAQPLWNEPLTLQDGSTTVSPFVTLGARG